MIKRVLLSLALCLAATMAVADPRDRDVLLTSDGTLYTVEIASNTTATNDQSSWYLILTTQTGTRRTSTPVPGSLAGGAHSNPALGYDAESDTLFLFWQQAENGGLSSRLLFSSYHKGSWSDATTLDSVDWDLHRNLKIAVTRFIEAGDAAGKRILVPQLTVHAVWWQESGMGEWARYAMITIDRGAVVDIQLRSLPEFAGLTINRTPLRSMSPHEVLRHPAVAATPGRDAVDIVFGHTQTDSLHRVRLKPTNDGRLRIPIGIRDEQVGRPSLDAGVNSIHAVIEGDRIAFYTTAEDALSFVLYKNGGWSNERNLALSEKITSEAAVGALRKMVAGE
ncbi:MAG TPA: hypothetical protein VMS98_15260 [Thermoanaerobaculia bacterium]|nr:hypothetical protein [Thermoanaerobaculia bacterium]